MNINKYEIVRIIEAPDGNSIYGICMINKNILLTGDENKAIKQWRIEGNNLILTSEQKDAHADKVNALLNIGNGHVASSSDDSSIKIW